MKRSNQEILTFLQRLYAERFGEPFAPSAASSAASPFVFASAPGRVELAGNHTDHQGGHTLSAAIDQRAWALAAPNDRDEIRVFMDGFGEATVSLSSLEARPDERGTSISLIRGMAAAYVESGGALRGFDMATCSDIPVGAGVSSSAAFEILSGTVIRALCGSWEEGDGRLCEDTSSCHFHESGNPVPCAADTDTDTDTDGLTLTKLALEGAWTEQNYFGKPCGAQDQLVSAFGGIVALDFAHETPRVTPIAFDFATHGYTLCLIDSRCDHSRYTDEFAAIPGDMHAVARFFDRERLGDVELSVLLEQLSEIRAQLGDRAALRALHFFEENERVQAQRQALKANDLEQFLGYVRLSGASSAQFLQNVSPHADTLRREQPAMLILALCAHLLDGAHTDRDLFFRGTYRIHGGGFGGSVLAFVPTKNAESFMAAMNGFLGYNACTPLSISAKGAHATRLV